MSKEEQWLLEEKYRGDANAPGFEADRRRLAEGEPAAYVIGYQPFLGLKIYLDSHPLIPRPETEWWVEHLLINIAKRERAGSLRFLDLCSGSGAIGCAMLRAFPAAEIYFGELDPAHEATVRKNIEINTLSASRAHIGIGDLFEPFGGMRFDVIAANPPYIPSGRALPASVSEYEPLAALYSGEDGLALTRRIAAELPAHLAPNGVAWIECDRARAEQARDLFEAAGLAARLMHDQYDRPRTIVLFIPGPKGLGCVVSSG